MIRRLSFVKSFLFFCLSLSFFGIFQVSATGSPIPTPARPIDAGFTPLRFHCRQETSPEFHPLRPYPASPCDPLIPQKLPRADRDDSRLYLTPYCAKSLNVWGRVPAPRVVDATNGKVDIYPGDPVDGVLYFCPGSYSQICFIRNISFNVTWDFSDSEFPILGNTQDYLEDIQKVNDYLDWYLNGTVQQSEQIALDPDSDTDMSRLVNFGGPVKKLLPYDSQTNLKDILQTRNIGTDYRDYDVVNPVWPNTPFSSQEDITSEATVSVYESLEGQPTAPQIDGQIISIGLSIGSADSRLYFPHLRSSRALSDILSGMIRPSPNNISSTNNDVVTQVIRYHQGTLSVEGDLIPGGADNTRVQSRSRPQDYPGRDQVSRNTEVIEYQPAPAPLLIYAELMGDSGQRCDLPAPSKPGDDLVGRQINGVLSYVQLFRYTPDIIIQDSCAAVGNPPNCRDNCAFEGDDCSSSEPCCYGSCPPEADFHCVYSDPNNIVIECPTYLTELLCVGNNNPCRWEAYATYCPAWPGNTLLNTGARAATFTKTPIVDKIYDTLIIGQQSVLRRFLPQQTSSGGEYLEGETDLNNAKEVATTANYTGNAISNFVVDDRVDAGNGGGGTLYFPRLQSLFRHFLGGNKDLNTNLQCLLRPYGACLPPQYSGCGCTGEAFRQIEPNPTAPTSTGLNFFNTFIRPRLTPEVVAAYQAAEEATGVPCEVLAGIHFSEGGNNPDQNLQNGGPLTGTLTESAINAGWELRRHNSPTYDGNDHGVPTNMNELIGAISRYNGGGNRNCQATTSTNCAPDEGFQQACGVSTACTDATLTFCRCNGNPGPVPAPGSCAFICDANNHYPYRFSYSGTCPPPTYGYDDPYATSYWQSEHLNMSLLYRYDCTATPPLSYDRPGSLTVAIALFLSEATNDIVTCEP